MPYPKHINPKKLPPNVKYDGRGRGRWVYRKYKLGKRVEIKIGDSTTTQAELWANYEGIAPTNAATFKGLSLEFQRTQKFKELAPSTRRDYENCHKAIINTVAESGTKAGDFGLDKWTKLAIRLYRDKRCESSRSRAAHELRYMKRLFRWAVEYGYMDTNPAKDISIPSTRREGHYIEDKDFLGALYLSPWKVAYIAHLAYLTGRRKGDLLKLNRHNFTAEGIELTEGKTQKRVLIPWTDNLKALTDDLYQDSITLNITASGFDSAWQRLRRVMKKAGFVAFRFQDIRGKHASDLDGDATANLLHSSAQVTKTHYLHKPTRVKSLQ